MLVVFLPFLLDVADYGRSVFQESREEIGKESLQSVDVMQVLEEIQNQKSQWSGSENGKATNRVAAEHGHRVHAVWKAAARSR